MGLNFGQNLFPPRGEAIVSYDYEDISTGTGTVIYNLITTADSGGTNYNLNENASLIFSSSIETTQSGDATTGTDVKVFDLDFDLSAMNTPRTIRGNAYIRYTWESYKIAGTGQSDGFMIVKIRKWDGVSETEIASIQTTTKLLLSTSTGEVTEMFKIIIPQTLIKKGENIRITFEGWTTNSSGTTSTYRFVMAHDPQNRDGAIIIPSNDATGNDTTASKVFIPFKILT